MWSVPTILGRFGWQQQGALLERPDWGAASFSLERYLDSPPGYDPNRFYGVCDLPADARGMGKKTDAALAFLDSVVDESAPWCCFVSFTEPHDPFYCHEDAFAQYDVDSIPLQPNVHNDLSGQPNLYKRAAQVWSDWTDREHREAAACYYASISEIDEQFGRLLERVENAGQLENTIVVLTSDHGDFLGAHGLYCKNIGAFEEAYNIPLVMVRAGCSRIGGERCPRRLARCRPDAAGVGRRAAAGPDRWSIPLRPCWPARMTLRPTSRVLPNTTAGGILSARGYCGTETGNSFTTVSIMTSFTIWPQIPTR